MPLGSNDFTPKVGDLVKVTRSMNKEIKSGLICRIAGLSTVPGIYYLEVNQTTPVRRQDFEVVAYMALPAGSKGAISRDKTERARMTELS